jgi:hypothetical protein
MSLSKDFLHFPGSATIEQVLRTYLDRHGDWWWLLTTEIGGEYRVCSFGSLLPYLTGRTPHIVHNIGDCAICSGMDPLLWCDTGALVEQALADATACSRLVSNLPLAELPVVTVEDLEGLEGGYWLVMRGGRALGVTENGVLSGIYIEQVKGDLGGLPVKHAQAIKRYIA